MSDEIKKLKTVAYDLPDQPALLKVEQDNNTLILSYKLGNLWNGTFAKSIRFWRFLIYGMAILAIVINISELIREPSFGNLFFFALPLFFFVIGYRIQKMIHLDVTIRVAKKEITIQEPFKSLSLLLFPIIGPPLLIYAGQHADLLSLIEARSYKRADIQYFFINKQDSTQSFVDQFHKGPYFQLQMQTQDTIESLTSIGDAPTLLAIQQEIHNYWDMTEPPHKLSH